MSEHHTNAFPVPPLRIEMEDGRFSRFELISWWDQERLSRARVLVAGAGAIGNEVIKNLALLGIGSKGGVFIADLDRIEYSNLSRSVLFRDGDCAQDTSTLRGEARGSSKLQTQGKFKATVAADRAREIYPPMRTCAFCGDVVHGLGLGIFRWADVIIGALDNREARLALNAAAAKAGKIWIDGAIEGLSGVARVFDPATGPCYECTMGEADWKTVHARRSCALLTREQMEMGRTPTTPTTASVIAGIQCQEAVKLLHGLELMGGRAGCGFVFDGMAHQSYTVEYTRDPDCPSHEPMERIEPLEEGIATLRAGDLLERIRRDLGPGAVLEFNHELVRALVCEQCGTDSPVLSQLGSITEAHARCPACGEIRTPRMYHALGDGPDDAPLLERTLEELGVPPWDILTGRRITGPSGADPGAEWQGMLTVHYELTGDRAEVLGPLDEAWSEPRCGSRAVSQDGKEHA